MDVLAQNVNARGMDILLDQAKIVGMVKTTETKLATRFGANQKKSIESDLERLTSDRYEGYSRYMFVRSPKAHHILTTKYASRFPAVHFVLLGNAHRQDVTGGSAASN